ncbi:Serine/Threonine protein kinase, partial [Candidatus Thiomargarita nelsonii]
AAIEINRQRFALHNVKKYPIRQLLGAGGMGCVLLCENQDLLRNPEHKQVAVKCFWESHKGEPDEVFGEALKMHKIAGDSVPKPLDYGYADESNEERAFFVSEYLEGAIDGTVIHSDTTMGRGLTNFIFFGCAMNINITLIRIYPASRIFTRL